MKKNTAQQKELTTKKLPISYLNLIVLILSIYVLGALLADTFFKLPPEISKVLMYIDNLICVFFIIEFSIRFSRAENKLRFMRWGWIDLIASIPTFSLLRYGRAIQIIRILRLLRAFRSVKHIITAVFANRMKGAFTSVSIIAILMVIFSSIAILQFETVPESNILTGEDAIWWSFTTITTVGYGDRYPVTTEGRVIAILLMSTGVGLFGVLSGTLASWFVADKNKEMKAEIMEEIEEEVEEEMNEREQEMKEEITGELKREMKKNNKYPKK
jgi:voltage-gated potassium channel